MPKAADGTEIKKWRVQRIPPGSLGGMDTGEREERIMALPVGTLPPPGAVEAARNASVTDEWKPVSPASAHAPAAVEPESGEEKK